MRGLIVISALFLILFGCKKQRLVKDKKVLIGEWDWSYTYTYYDTTYSNANVKSCKLMFYKKGKFEIFKNDVLIAENKTDFLQFETSNDTFYFSIKLKNPIKPETYSYTKIEETYLLSGFGVNSTLNIYQYPYIFGKDYFSYPTYFKVNYFEKKQ